MSQISVMLLKRVPYTIGAALSPQTERGPDLTHPPNPPRSGPHYPRSIMALVGRNCDRNFFRLG